MKRTAAVFVTAIIAASALLLGGCAGSAPEPHATAESVDLGIDPEFGSTMAACMVDRGWDADVTGDGGVLSDVPEGQEEPYDADLAECEKENGLDTIAPALTEPELRLLYLMELDTAECIRVQGLDPGNPPSEQTFVDSALADGNAWDPYAEVYTTSNSQVTEDEYFALLEKCPRPGY
ncbi:hypothetical protein ACFC14_03025 [Microbacterium sp. NPDC055988]|uniref:hypothetical protein n=1 Tax=Microbacterium sp. NPDC055988 TaxID=3345671 RepID=UPI0035E2C64F